MVGQTPITSSKHKGKEMSLYTLYVDVKLSLSTSVQVEASSLKKAKEELTKTQIAQNLFEQLVSDSSQVEDCMDKIKIWRHEKE